MNQAGVKEEGVNQREHHGRRHRSAVRQSAQEIWSQNRLYVLTLPHAVDRQKSLLIWSEQHGLGKEIFFHGDPSAGDPSTEPDKQTSTGDPPPANPLTQERYGRDRLQPPELGCQIGHRRIYERMLETACAWALILEDDVIPMDPDWPLTLNQLMARIDNSRLKDMAWVCHVGITPAVHRTLALRPVQWRRGPESAALVEGDGSGWAALGQLDPRIGQLWTTHAYLISSGAAKAILEREPAGTYVADDWSLRLKLGLINPMLATMKPLFAPNGSLPTQIPQRTEFSSPSTGLALHYRVQRKLRTLFYQAGLWPAIY